MLWLEIFLIVFLLIIIWILNFDLKQAKNENKKLNESYRLLKEDYSRCYYLYLKYYNKVEECEDKIEARKFFGSIY